MAVYNAINGQAPPGLKVGDTVNTNGGLYQIVHPGTPGSKYNPKSGYSSIKMDGNLSDSLTAYSQAQSERNTARSEQFAERQMNFQMASNAKAMQFNAEQARINREWQEKMSNTAHQREVNDLIAAGLNPVLSATGGAGSSTPAGSSASGVTSPGASGSVDTSSSEMVGALLSALIAQSTALETTALNNMTSLKGAQISAGALLGATGITAQNALEKQQMINDFELYMRQNYPNTQAGLISSLMQSILGAFSSDNDAKGNSKLYNLIRRLNNILAPYPDK